MYCQAGQTKKQQVKQGNVANNVLITYNISSRLCKTGDGIKIQ